MQEILQTSGLGRFGVADLDDWLRGEWRFARTINADVGTCRGTATFEPAHRPRELVWRERGRLRLGAYDGPSTRTLRIAPAAPLGGDQGDNNGYAVSFDDGRPFHLLDLTAGRCDAVHHCGPDVYRGVYEVHDAAHFAVTWRVEGPRKRDVIATRYARAA